jgi:hypothetical protein
MNVKPKRRKCHGCNDFFIPDFRNQDRQCYCSKPECRQASKRASQERWLRQPANRDYFRGSENVQRVRDWRQAHPGYWKKKTSPSGKAQIPGSQQVNPKQVSCNVPPSPLGTLQDFCLAKDPGFIGLVAMITGSTLQEDIAATTRRVVEQGRNILGLNLPGKMPSTYDLQTSAPRGSPAANPAQL